LYENGQKAFSLREEVASLETSPALSLDPTLSPEPRSAGVSTPSPPFRLMLHVLAMVCGCPILANPGSAADGNIRIIFEYLVLFYTVFYLSLSLSLSLYFTNKHGSNRQTNLYTRQ